MIPKQNLGNDENGQGSGRQKNLEQRDQWFEQWSVAHHSLDVPSRSVDSDSFYYFAYGSCMCPVDLKRSLGEPMHPYVVGAAILQGYRLGFFRRSRIRNCGVLDIVQDANAHVHGVLYRLPMRVSDRLDAREEGYCHEMICVERGQSLVRNVRTYTVIDKASQEYAPNDWYFNVVMRGAVTCGLPEHYCWKLFHHMHRLQNQLHAVSSLSSSSVASLNSNSLKKAS